MENLDVAEVKEFHFKMDKIERYISFGVFLIFFLSFSGKNSGFWTIVLLAVTIVIMAYYFIWYRKKPAYLVVENEQITVHPPLFYKPQEIKQDEIKQVKVSDKKIEIYVDGSSKSIDVYSILLDKKDWEQIAQMLECEG